ncbi:Hsp20/alpha crystallin family protein [Aquibacillus sediminis]|uniref:Hsp20/alpha crystallin family protein n=1 Tax=Aquibacillus sediminis TaxID=2574734 RepID=UPI0011081ED9|nr:Hsp20/alpha crystallin family protein [Aquibacillus sediminis]
MGKGSNYPSKDFGDFGHDLLKKMDELFYSTPSQNILDSIDTFFQQNNAMGKLPVDVYETDKEWVVKADLPGINKEDIHVNIIGDRVTIQISNEQEMKTEDEKNAYYRRERKIQRAERSVQLPYVIDKQKTKARFHNGVLEIKGPKQPKTDGQLEIE